MSTFSRFLAPAMAPARIGANVGGLTAGTRRFGQSSINRLGMRVAPDLARLALQPASREFSYHINRAAPNVVPSPDDIVWAYYCDRLSAQQTQTLLKYNGVNYEAPPVNELGEQQFGGGSFTKQAWQQIVDLGWPTLDLDTVHDYWRRGWVQNPEYLQRLADNGMTIERDQQLLLADLGFPDLATGHEMWVRGLLDDAALVSLARRHGLANTPWPDLYTKLATPYPLGLLFSSYHQGLIPPAEFRAELAKHGFAKDEQFNRLMSLSDSFSPFEALLMFYRGEIGPIDLGDLLKANGLRNAPLNDKWIKANRPLPPVSDLISFSVREVWDQRTVNRFGYDAEFPEAFRFWMGRHGLDWGEATPDALGGMSPAVTWPRAYWRSHWHPLAPTQGYVAYHRLREGRWQRYEAEVPGLNAFTWEDLNETLKVADYPPAVRKWLAASAFTPLRLVDIRNMVILRLRDRDWAVEQFRDRGLAIPDAEDSADLVIRQRREKERAPIRRIEQQAIAESTRQVVEAYSIGIITNQIALANLRTAGMRESTAQLVLNNADYKVNIGHVKEAILDVRKSYFTGAFTPEGVRIALKQIGIRQDAIERYLSRWFLRRTHRRRMISTAQIVRWVKAGMMDQRTANSQLGNLGWDQPSALLIIAEGIAGLRKLQAAGVQAAERQRLSRAKQLQSLVEKGQRQVRQFQADLRRETSLQTLSKWVKAGRISHALFLRRMVAMGYTPGVANAYLKDAIGSTGEAEGVEAPAPPQGQGQGQPAPSP